MANTLNQISSQSSRGDCELKAALDAAWTAAEAAWGARGAWAAWAGALDGAKKRRERLAQDEAADLRAGAAQQSPRGWESVGTSNGDVL